MKYEPETITRVDEEGKQYHNYSIDLENGAYVYGRIYFEGSECYAHLHNENGEYMTNVRSSTFLDLIFKKDSEGLEDYIERRWRDHEEWVRTHNGDADYEAEF